MKRLLFAFVCFSAIILAGCSGYETATNDPMNNKVYTLSNGLKLYMTVNKDEPRIQTYIAVRVGGQDDPADNTGLAHYLEHMLFKGSKVFGTQNYEAEAPMLEQIDSLFEVYRTLTDPAQREAMYAKIDSVSYEASKLAIPNEYDKLMSLIGSQGSNAFTSEDVTCYIEEIPSNQVDNWARIQADRFRNCVFRGFHTELEAVYEEKNTCMADDTEKAIDALNAMLFPGHPYGTQTVIGTQDHLKNPSIRAIRKQKDTYYVPNNMAICMSGDFDPDQMVKTIKKYFGDWEPNPDLPRRKPFVAPALPGNQSADVNGFESEFVLMGWRIPGRSAEDAEYGNLASSIMMNGLAGLVDLNVVQKQKVLDVIVSPYDRADGSIFLIQGFPKNGQSLEEVEAILKEQANKLVSGDFSDELMAAACANYRLSIMHSMENNRSRAGLLLNNFIDGKTIQQAVDKARKSETLPKEELVSWASQFITPQNYAVVYKHTGPDPSVKRIEAPKITPIVTNRDKQSDFFQEIAAVEVEPLEPVFVDYTRDMTVDSYKGLTLLYKKNEKNDIATMTFWYDRGVETCPELDLGLDYLHFLGTPSMTPTQFAARMYSLASRWSMNVTDNVTNLTIHGLGEHTEEVLSMMVDVTTNTVADEKILAELKEDKLRARADEMTKMGAINGALQRYTIYGPEYIKSSVLSNNRLRNITSEELLAAVRDLISCRHKILYYGPASLEEVKQMLSVLNADNLRPVERSFPKKRLTKEPKVFVAQYNSRQFNYTQYSNRGESLIVEQAPYIELFNEYYGSGMNSIVFQEMRESRALAYSAGAKLVRPSFTNDDYYFRATISSQNDKLRKAVEGFEDIIENLPESPENFEIAKQAILNRIRTVRVHGLSVLYNYMRTRDLGLDFPREKLIYEKVGNLTMFDLLSTHQEWIRGRTYYYSITGDIKDMDMNFLRTLGPVKVVTPEEMFGY